MNKSLLTLTASAFLLASTMGAAQAQSTGDDDDTMQQGQQGERMTQGRDDKKKYGKHGDRHSGMRHHRMGRGMGRGMGHGAMMHVVFAIMDANGDGSLSLEEVQEAHARIFAHMDADDDDQVTKKEIKSFFKGGKDRRGSSRRDRSDSAGNADTADGDDLNLSDEVGDEDQ